MRAHGIVRSVPLEDPFKSRPAGSPPTRQTNEGSGPVRSRPAQRRLWLKAPEHPRRAKKEALRRQTSRQLRVQENGDEMAGMEDTTSKCSERIAGRIGKSEGTDTAQQKVHDDHDKRVAWWWALVTAAAHAHVARLEAYSSADEEDDLESTSDFSSADDEEDLENTSDSNSRVIRNLDFD